MLLAILKVLPRNILSRFVGRLMALESPGWLIRVLKIWFAGHYQIRLDEAERDFDEYASIGALFTRKLKEGLRPIQGDLVHPCDSKVAQSGEVTDGMLLQAKGWTYSLADLIGCPKLAASLDGGNFTTYYLCPTDYHRVHSPVDGQVLKVRHIPGTLWPVNEVSVRGVAGLFIKNERMVFEIDTVFGTMALVMVGATNVGKITTTVGPDWESNLAHISGSREEKIDEDKSSKVKAGQELGVFHMGSTVICTWPKEAGIKPLDINQDVLMGQGVRV